ncbi:MAG: sugar transferase [Spirochaetes bacterium]|nr:sugar transferase [Spirochaetota bacterium]
MSADFIDKKIRLYSYDIYEVKLNYYIILKRFIDLLLSVFGIILFSPLFIIIYILIKITTSGNVFFKQIRIGKNYKKFYIYKFKTMISSSENNNLFITSTDDERITKLGAILRKFKLDELPQLFNVLKGDMSIVGPRPEVPKYVIDNINFNKILTVKPGITDFASIKYINEEDILYKAKKNGNTINSYYIENILPDKIELAHQYINNMSIITDLFIIIKTFLIVFNIQKNKRSDV